jgi:hypothetical protein
VQQVNPTASRRTNPPVNLHKYIRKKEKEKKKRKNCVYWLTVELLHFCFTVFDVSDVSDVPPSSIIINASFVLDDMVWVHWIRKKGPGSLSVPKSRRQKINILIKEKSVGVVACSAVFVIGTGSTDSTEAEAGKAINEERQGQSGTRFQIFFRR